MHLTGCAAAGFCIVPFCLGGRCIGWDNQLHSRDFTFSISIALIHGGISRQA